MFELDSLLEVIFTKCRTLEECRIGTTVATNALLEHKGKQFALLTTKGIVRNLRIFYE